MQKEDEEDGDMEWVYAAGGGVEVTAIGPNAWAMIDEARGREKGR